MREQLLTDVWLTHFAVRMVVVGLALGQEAALVEGLALVICGVLVPELTGYRSCRREQFVHFLAAAALHEYVFRNVLVVASVRYFYQRVVEAPLLRQGSWLLAILRGRQARLRRIAAEFIPAYCLLVLRYRGQLVSGALGVP